MVDLARCDINLLHFFNRYKKSVNPTIINALTKTEGVDVESGTAPIQQT
jgi:hypothetical protein